MNGSPSFEVVIDGAVQAEKFSDEESANTFAGQKRKSSDQKIAVYEIGSKRHQKCFEAKLTPTDPAPSVRPSKK